MYHYILVTKQSSLTYQSELIKCFLIYCKGALKEKEKEKEKEKGDEVALIINPFSQ